MTMKDVEKFVALNRDLKQEAVFKPGANVNLSPKKEAAAPGAARKRRKCAKCGEELYNREHAATKVGDEYFCGECSEKGWKHDDSWTANPAGGGHWRRGKRPEESVSPVTEKEMISVLADLQARRKLAEKAPPGFEGTVKRMKRKKGIKNPYALAWSMKKKGAKSHYKASGAPKKG